MFNQLLYTEPLQVFFPNSTGSHVTLSWAMCASFTREDLKTKNQLHNNSLFFLKAHVNTTKPLLLCAFMKVKATPQMIFKVSLYSSLCDTVLSQA